MVSRCRCSPARNRTRPTRTDVAFTVFGEIVRAAIRVANLPKENIAMKEHLEAIKIEASREGDVVFIATGPDLSVQAYQTYSKMLQEHADAVRKRGEFLPRCVVLASGMSVTVAREPQAADQTVA